MSTKLTLESWANIEFPSNVHTIQVFMLASSQKFHNIASAACIHFCLANYGNYKI